jgi:hypothetical protein
MGKKVQTDNKSQLGKNTKEPRHDKSVLHCSQKK